MTLPNWKVLKKWIFFDSYSPNGHQNQTSNLDRPTSPSEVTHNLWSSQLMFYLTQGPFYKTENIPKTFW